MADILIVSSQIHHELSKTQRQLCMAMLDSFSCRYDIEEINTGTYEIPFVINAYGICNA